MAQQAETNRRPAGQQVETNRGRGQSQSRGQLQGSQGSQGSQGPSTHLDPLVVLSEASARLEAVLGERTLPPMYLRRRIHAGTLDGVELVGKWHVHESTVASLEAELAAVVALEAGGRVFSPRTAAPILGCTPKAVQSRISNGQIKAHKLFGRWRITEAHLRECLGQGAVSE